MTSPIGTQISDVVRRHVRAFSYPEDSEMGLFSALAVPLDEPVSTKSTSVAFFFEANYKLPVGTNDDVSTDGKGSRGGRKHIVDRRKIYSVLESKFETFGYRGRQCLLKSICETARRPLHAHNGLLGDLLRIILMPSSSAAEADLHPDYAEAEDVDTKMDCARAYSTCDLAIYDHITQLF